MSLSTSGRTWEQASEPGALHLARRFEDAWRDTPHGAPRPVLADYLAEAAEHAGCRLALLRADLNLRWESGEKVDAASYRDSCGGLGDETFVALLYEEFCLREEAGENPEPAAYLERYPDVASGLRRVLDIHGLVVSASTASMSRGEPTASAIDFPRAGETIAGFRLCEELGRGSFARVFRAEERQLADRPVALKVARRGSREPQTLARLQHTHIVPVYSYRIDASTGLHLLCMPFFGRLTLARVLADAHVREARRGADLLEAIDRLDDAERDSPGRATARLALARRSYPQALAWWGARMAEALQHAHERGVLHRDIKPSNVLITSDAMPMLLDFNLARAFVPDARETEEVIPGGTLDYMAPEQIEEMSDGLSDRADARSDIYGLGVVLYEALMGARPFAQPKGASGVRELLQRASALRRAGAPRLRAKRPEVSAALDAIVRKCLAPDPERRYPTASALAEDLSAVADDRPLKHASEPWPDRTLRWARRHRRAIAAAVPILCASLLIAWLLVREQVGRNQLWTKVRRFYDQGVSAEQAGDFAQARALYESAVRLIDKPDPNDDANAPGVGPASLLSGLPELRQQARMRYLLATRAEEYRNRADEVSRAADSLRFRLFNFNDDLDATSRELQRLLAPFFVFESADWIQRPDLQKLDEPRRARLIQDVKTLLFLWAVALDGVGTQEAFASSIQICDHALTFATAPGPWRALRERVAHRLNGMPSPQTAAAPDEPSALGCFFWGFLRLREDRRDEAIAYLSRAVDREPGNYWYQYCLAFAFDSAGGANATEALRHYDAALAIEPRSPWVRFSRAPIYRARHAWKRAMDDLRRALDDSRALPAGEQVPTFEARVRLELGLVRQSLGDLSGARSEYERVIGLGSSPALVRAARLNRAKLDMDAGFRARGRAEYEALVESGPTDRLARIGRALIALRAGDAQRADEDLSTLLALGPDPDLLARRALARLILGHPEEALSDAESALRRQPGRRAERLRSRALLALGRVDELHLNDPEELDALPKIGRSLRADLRAAVDLLRVAEMRASTGASPRALDRRLTLAVLLSALGDPRAEVEANRAVESAPLASRPYLVRARIRRQMGRLTAAREDVEHALLLEKDDPRAWILRARLAAQSGQPRAALADTNRALALEADGPDLRAIRAKAFRALKNPSAAFDEWSVAVTQDPDDPRSYLGRAEASIDLGQWDQAFGDLEQAAGWADAQPALSARIAFDFARCLPSHPERFPRLLGLIREAWVSRSSVTSKWGFLGATGRTRPLRYTTSESRGPSTEPVAPSTHNIGPGCIGQLVGCAVLTRPTRTLARATAARSTSTPSPRGWAQEAAAALPARRRWRPVRGRRTPRPGSG